MNVIEIVFTIVLSAQLCFGIWLFIDTIVDRKIGVGKLIAGILCLPGVLVVGAFAGIVWLFSKLDEKILWRW